MQARIKHSRLIVPRVSKRESVIPRYNLLSELRPERTAVPEEDVPVLEPPPAMSRSSTGSDGLQPSGVLNHEAMKGRFSLRNILGSGENERPERHEGDHSGSPDDPIRLGLINISIAQCLFDQ